VQDFMRDSLKLHRDDTVESICVGRFTIVMEAGPHAVLALVVQGSPPPELRLRAQEALETSHLELREELTGFRGGDMEPFARAEPLLRSCLQGELKASERRFPVFAAVLGVLLLAALGAGIGYAVHGRVLRARLLDRLAETPGIVVVETGRQGLRLRIDALKDPAAGDPQDIASAVGFPPGGVVFRLKPYYAMAPELTLEHVRRILNPPATVRLSLKDGVVHADGSADARWVEESRLRAEAIPGVRGFEASDQGGAERAEMADLISGIRETSVAFQANAAEPVPGQDAVLGTLAARIVRFAELARGFGFETKVTATGHSAGIVADAESIRISHERAAAAIRSLESRGAAGVEFQGRAVGICDPVQEEKSAADRAKNRRVSFAVEAVTKTGR
jgi:outer membrane protein OmpA-like peptidoglycan-associated protein